MARGYGSIHPLMAKPLQRLGVEDWQITQGWGSARASAGFHSAEGKVDGHSYSSCVDLTFGLADRGREFYARLVEAGFCPFYRYGGSWAGNEHIHAVFVGISPCRILAGPRQQVIDFTRGLNGLVGHAALTGTWAPTADERAQILEQYRAWAPHVATAVLSPEGKALNCYAFYDLNTVRCEAAAALAWWGYKLDQKTLVARNAKGKTLDLNAIGCRPKLEGGQFIRANVRQLHEALGLKVAFEWAADKRSATIRLS